APASGADPSRKSAHYLHILSGRPLVLSFPAADDHRRAADVLLPAGDQRGLPGHERPRHADQFRPADAEYPPLLGAWHGDRRVPAYAARLLYGRVPSAPRVQLGHWRDPALLHV